MTDELDQPLDEKPCRDQLLAFVEGPEMERCAGEVDTDAGREAFRKRCAEYLNSVRNVEFQNQCISDLIEQLEPPVDPAVRRSRASFFGAWLSESVTGRPRAAEPSELSPTSPLDPATKSALRLDISDRLAKRHFARKHRVELAAQLTPLVNDLRMKLFAAVAEGLSESPTFQSRERFPGTGGSGKAADDDVSTAQCLRQRTSGPASAVGPQPVVRRVYTDSEVKAVLKRHAKAD